MIGRTKGFRGRVQAHGKTAMIGVSAVAALSAGAVIAVTVDAASGSSASGHHATGASHFRSEPKAGHSRQSPEPRHRPTATTLTIAQLPVRRELGRWSATQGDGPVLVCVPEDVMEGLTPESTQTVEFGAHGARSSENGPFLGRIGEQVLTFADDTAASSAVESVASWIHDCAARDLNRPGSIESKSVTGPGQGFWETFLRSAPAVCTECDAINFDRQAVVQTGNRLVLLSMSEVGGPLQPEGLTRAMRTLVGAAVRTASRG